MIVSAVGSLTQPLFNKGQLIANLKVAKAQQEEALLASVFVAQRGSEVSNALVLHNSSTEKSRLGSWSGSLAGKSGKLYATVVQQVQPATWRCRTEVVTGAQLSKVSDDFYRMQAVKWTLLCTGGGR